MDGPGKKYKETKVKSTKTVKEANVIVAFFVILIWKPDKLSRLPVRAVPKAIE